MSRVGLDFLTLRAQRFSRSLIQVRLRLPKFLFEFSARIHADTRHTRPGLVTSILSRFDDGELNDPTLCPEFRLLTIRSEHRTEFPPAAEAALAGHPGFRHSDD